jgi:hypothetical protein
MSRSCFPCRKRGKYLTWLDMFEGRHRHAICLNQLQILVFLVDRWAKTDIASFLAEHLAVASDFEHLLGPGERATVLCLACDRSDRYVT